MEGHEDITKLPDLCVPMGNEVNELWRMSAVAITVGGRTYIPLLVP